MREHNMAGFDREREPYSRPPDFQVAHKPTRMDPPYTAEGSDGRRSEHRGSFAPPKPPTPSSSAYYSNGDRTRSLPHIDTTRRGTRADGRRSVEASPRDTPMSDVGYVPRRRDNDRSDDRFIGHSRRDSTDGVFGTGSSTGGRTPSTATGIHGHSPTMSALSSTPQQSNALGPAADISTNASGIISDASYSYVKFMDATKRYHAAKTEKVKHEEHFTNFPVMRERYEGALSKAEKEMRKAQEEWNVKGILVDTFLKSIVRAQQPQQFEDLARRVSQEVIYKDIGTPSIEKYIEKAVNEKVSSLVPAGMMELREEMNALKERDLRRSTELAELKTSIGKLETGLKAVEAKHSNLGDNVEEMGASIHALKKDVLDAQQLAVIASDAMQKLDGLKARVDQKM
ncbi:hypothetical protein BDD12DRAFT_507393 [Trichophaea hybrida]|nr:hypothetical protein BDD12DRAFT_507393 [Trichophaea hybrida]